MSAAVSGHHHHHHHSGAGPLSLMSCVRESSPPQDGGHELEPEKHGSNKRKFWNPRKWFKRKSNKVAEESQIHNNEEHMTATTRETIRSRSTSELSIAEEQQQRRRSGTPMHPGLSVSHDSVFHSPHSGSELELENAQSSSSLSIMGHPIQPADIRLQTELSERLRQRRNREDTSEDDEGLPRSPCNSPTTTEGIAEKGASNKDIPTKSHSTCSDGSLLSMASSEMDDDTLSSSTHSRYSSSKQSTSEKNRDTIDADITEWGPGNATAPLNHSAAHHKVSIRPKRTHGAPRRKKPPPVVLPTTPEVNEETSLRSLTPETIKRENASELYSSLNYQLDNKFKCSSLPPGLAAPVDPNKLIRSRSNAGGGNKDAFIEEEEVLVENKKGDHSFLSRIFPRRSGKKQKKVKEEQRKEKEEVTESYEPFDQNMITVDSNLAIRPNALRTTPRFSEFNSGHQHVEILPASEFLKSEREALVIDEHEPYSQSPPKVVATAPRSPWNETRMQFTTRISPKFVDSSSTGIESKSVIRIAGLSSLQQRVLSLQDEPDLVSDTNNFKSLTNLSSDGDKFSKPVAKSHSFKSTKQSSDFGSAHEYKSLEADRSNIFKSVSLDSIKTLNDKVVESVNHCTVGHLHEETHFVSVTSPIHKAVVNIIPQKDKINKEQSVSKVHLNVDPESLMDTNPIPQMSPPASPTFETVDDVLVKDIDGKVIGREVDQVEEEPKPIVVRKFSNDNIEVIKKEDKSKLEDEMPAKPALHSTRKTSESERPMLQSRSLSFESEVKSKSNTSTPKSSQSSLDMMETSRSQENIVENSVRRRSVVKQKQEDEPELMKVFARRSLKLKDTESEALSEMVLKLTDVENTKDMERKQSRDSDKENVSSDSSPIEERKKSLPIVVAPKTALIIDNKTSSEANEVVLRKPIVSIGRFQTRNQETIVTKAENKVFKQISLLDKPKTDSWIMKCNNEDEKKDVGKEVDGGNNNNNNGKSEIISCLSEKSHNIDLVPEPKNFSQRKAEWEKRAQEALRKTMP